MKIEYDIYMPVGKRVKRARALCTRCEVPKYEDINSDEIYQVVVNSFIAAGGDFHDVIKDNKIRHFVGRCCLVTVMT